MAIDTESKRRSTIGMGLPWHVIHPVPDGAITAPDRYGIWVYSGLLSTENSTDFGREYLHTASKHKGTNTYYFEGYFRATTGTAFMELVDVTLGTVVSGSRVTNAASSHDRVRSSAITLVDGNEYQARATVEDGDAGALLGGVIIEQLN